MTVSLFDLFSIGIGPSSSHTIGPMRAANAFLSNLPLEDIQTVEVHLYGSLALTGQGHGTDRAVLMGLEGHLPEHVDPEHVMPRMKEIIENNTLCLLGKKDIPFFINEQLLFHKKETLLLHANGMKFIAYDQKKSILAEQTYYSIGGGFIVTEEHFKNDLPVSQRTDDTKEEEHTPYPFDDAKTLLRFCQEENTTIAEIMLANEKTWRSEEAIREGILALWHVMDESITRGSQKKGTLPGGLDVPRRAAHMREQLRAQHTHPGDKRDEMSWLSVYSIAVNEENAAGGRVVTAPTNGAAGTIPAVIRYYLDFCDGTEEGIIEFMLTAAAVGILYKKGASISAAEVGCQGEVGVACSMAAAGLASVFGATIAQIENAAEIGMEHNLGMTCDPINGLVQIPCIERNAMGAVQAVNAARLALLGDGQHTVSLDNVIATMLQTGKDMMSIYKETAQGGLAVHLTEC